MPRKQTVQKAKAELREGKSPGTAAGEFVHEEIKHVREGKHGARSAKQAIAIGLSKARRSGIPLPPPGRKKARAKTRKAAKRDYETGQGRRARRSPSRRRSRATRAALRRERTPAASRTALSRQARRSATRGRTRSKTTARKRGRR